jgi:type III restriction enzyme
MVSEPQEPYGKVKFDYDYTPGKLTENWKLFNELFA